MAVDVVGVGVAVIDLKVTVSSVPKPEEVVLAYDYHKHHGGPVANALVTLQRLGMRTQYMGMFGDDEYGRLILDGMNAEGIDTKSVRLAKDENSAFSIVMVDSETKARAIAFHAGCGLSVPADCIDPEAIKSARLLHVDISTPAVRAACEIARSKGIPISVDADALFPGLEELLEMASIFIPSNDIASALVGEDDPAAAGERILKKYHLDVVGATCGKEGSIVVTPKETVHVPGFRVDVADTTGAGGVYKGAYLYGHLNGWPIRRTARFANAAAALMCSGMNGWADIPTLKKVEDLLLRHNKASDNVG
ncbi:MAG: carbohydrate kinase family protein [Candidatus Abyssobacteria bacterium SURF_17]|uniref:Carbohydrate kinase family protein n=1 Tax=Candidatus Abyssobacteria bacterium SURF_17 TaxID=2093361 RepID=A0A419EXY9_9BACT|nr:MAG: carbohydrate kinase family protein [Candidatus Abyssubacteria bacterium SURF_17]